MENLGTLKDEVLINRFMNGDKEAYGILAERHKPAVQAFLMQMAQNWHDAEDMAQEVIIKAYENMRYFRNECTFKTWLGRMARNLFLDHAKAKAITNRVDMDMANLDKPTAELFGNEISDEPTNAIVDLPAKSQQILKLHFINGVKPQQIAQMLGLTISNVRVTLHRSTRKLNALLTTQKEEIYG